MATSSPPVVFRIGPLATVVVLAICSPVVALGVVTVQTPDVPWWFSGVPLLVGLLGLTQGLAYFVTRITAGPGGVRKRPRLLGGFAFGWDEVAEWSVVEGPAEAGGPDPPLDVRFRLAGRWFPVYVGREEVLRPGFDVFLAIVRAAVGDREAAR